MKTIYYTIGQIFRLGLMKGRDGSPYKDKAAILRRVRKMKHKRVVTLHGEGYGVTAAEIAKHNRTVAK